MRTDKKLYPLLKVVEEEKYHTDVIFQTIDECLRKQEILNDVYEILDYGKASFRVTELEPEKDYELHCQVNIGGSEGIYMDVYLMGPSCERISIATYKTLEDDLEASVRMGKLAGAFEFLYNLYYCINW